MGRRKGSKNKPKKQPQIIEATKNIEIRDDRIGAHPITQRILDVMKERNIKKKDFAEFLGVSPSLISKWAVQKYLPSSEDLVKICNYLNVSVNYVLTGEGTSNKLTTINIPKLTPDEKELIGYYRVLSDEQKGETIASLRAISYILFNNVV